MTLEVNRLFVNVQISENLSPDPQYDFAQINAMIELKNPLAQELRFKMPKETGLTTRIYLPDGTQVFIGDGDVSTAQSYEENKSMFLSLAQQGAEAPSIENLKSITKAYEKILDYTLLGDEVVFQPGIQKIALRYTKQVPKDSNGIYNFQTNIPLPEFVLVSEAGAAASLRIMMPAYLTADKIIKKQWTPIDGATQELNLVQVYEQIELQQHWQYDPFIDVQYTR